MFKRIPGHCSAARVLLIACALACDDATGIGDDGNEPSERPGPASEWTTAIGGSLQRLEGVWALSADEAYAVGEAGTILRFDGTAVQVMESGTEVTLHAVWGRSSSDIYAAGEEGTILHFDGQAWTPMPTPTSQAYSGVWGTARETFAVVGTELHVLNRGTWQTSRSFGPTADGTVRLGGISGTPDGEMFVVGSAVRLGGDAGSAYPNWVAWWYDGATWRDVALPAREYMYQSRHLIDVWVSGAGEAIAIGGNDVDGFGGPAVLEFSGLTWQSASVPELIRPGVYAIHGNEDGLAFIVGRTGDLEPRGAPLLLRRNDNGSWSRIEDVPAPTPLRDVWVLSSGEAFAVGDGGSILRFDGTRWALVARGVPPIHALTGERDDEIVAAGDLEALHFDGSEWSAPGVNATLYFRGIWDSGQNGLFGVGYSKNGEAAIFRFDGTEWRHLSYVSSALSGLLDVDGLGPLDGLAVGREGVIVRYTPEGWIPGAAPTDEDLRAVWASEAESAYYAVGDAGTILRYDGTDWQHMDSPTDADLTGVWGTANGDILAVGATADGGVILRFDGGAWSVELEVEDGLHAIHGISADEIYAGGENGAVWLYDGQSWSLLGRPTAGRITSFAGSVFSDIWAGTDTGVLLRGAR